MVSVTDFPTTKKKLSELYRSLVDWQSGLQQNLKCGSKANIPEAPWLGVWFDPEEYDIAAFLCEDAKIMDQATCNATRESVVQSKNMSVVCDYMKSTESRSWNGYWLSRCLRRGEYQAQPSDWQTQPQSEPRCTWGAVIDKMRQLIAIPVDDSAPTTQAPPLVPFTRHFARLNIGASSPTPAGSSRANKPPPFLGNFSPRTASILDAEVGESTPTPVKGKFSPGSQAYSDSHETVGLPPRDETFTNTLLYSLGEEASFLAGFTQSVVSEQKQLFSLRGLYDAKTDIGFFQDVGWMLGFLRGLGEAKREFPARWCQELLQQIWTAVAYVSEHDFRPTRGSDK